MPELTGPMRRRCCKSILRSIRSPFSTHAEFDAKCCRITTHVSCRAALRERFLRFLFVSASVSASFGGGSGGEKFFAVGDEAFLLGGGHGEYGAGSGREFVGGEG